MIRSQAQATKVPTPATRTSIRQMRHVELQGVDASRIIQSLTARSGRGWPTATRTH